MPEDPVVRLPPLVGRQHDSWLAFIEIAPSLGANHLLIGGQMVLLHEVERGSAQTRPTDDIDVIIDLRVEPDALSRIHRHLTAAGFDQSPPSADGIAHRYTRATATIDVLAPDHLGERARLALGDGRTIGVPGSTQAVNRSGWIRVQMAEGSNARIRRPTLIGALLGKAAAVLRISPQTSSERSKHLSDLDSLACLAGPSDRHDAELTAKQRTSLRQIIESYELSSLARRSIELLAERGVTP